MLQKSKLILTFLSLSLASYAFSNVNGANQDSTTIIGEYEGHEDYGYNFIATRDDDDSEYTITFQKVNDDVLAQFNLQSDELIGMKFKITYKVKLVVTKDENGFDDENEIYTITALEKM
ncbi:hypothetical protein OE09_0474 [Flavobacteriaceae bacterium MAR_2010_72]|nr:hypothetical protein OE09_0474 [Flavobacteriaceae bacterium MAR_2010_72]TVZ57874.1 hypothetical protein NA63_0364 [Flavobacteriaceae bacterium MAR_2010_105]